MCRESVGVGYGKKSLNNKAYNSSDSVDKILTEFVYTKDVLLDEILQMIYISKNIMYKKFTALCCYIKKLSDRYDKYEFLKIFENIPYIEVDISNLVALLIDKETKQFYLYTD